MNNFRYNKLCLTIEIILRAILLLLFCYMEQLQPFQRYITQGELESDLKYPRRDQYVPPTMLWSMVLLAPVLTIGTGYAFCTVPNDVTESFLSFMLALGLNGVLTDVVKLTVGRPRPDFYYRCFPDGVSTPDLTCTGNVRDITNGRKSFPSGHSSFSFCAFGFVSLWLCGRLGVFARRGKRRGLRLVVALSPLLVALLVAISRTCDYHHHWQDVTVGSILGFSIAYVCYRHHYNPLASELSGTPYCNNSSSRSATPSSDRKPNESTLLLDQEKDSKWI